MPQPQAERPHHVPQSAAHVRRNPTHMGDISCDKVPANFTQVGTLDNIRPCKKCTVRLVTTPGPGRLTPSRTGFTVDESPLNVLYYNGLEHTLKETHLLIRGEHGASHVLPGESNPVAEFLFFFERAQAIPYCVVVPVMEGKGVGNTYFQQLNQIVRQRAAISALFNPTAQLLQYTGSDLRGRYGSAPATAFPSALCATKVRYLVTTQPAYIPVADLVRLTQSLSASDYTGPVTAKTALTPTELQTYVTRVPKLVLEAAKVAGSPTGVPDDVYLTRELQCRRLDTAKDIEGDKVYVGGARRPGDSTLDKELAAAADSQAAFAEAGASIQPGTIETILAIVLGSVIGFLILLGAFFFFWKMSGRNYLHRLGQDYPKIFDPIKQFFKGRPAPPSA